MVFKGLVLEVGDMIVNNKNKNRCSYKSLMGLMKESKGKYTLKSRVSNCIHEEVLVFQLNHI
jgi:hypothetical protein